jgi:hypothetical protein
MEVRQSTFGDEAFCDLTLLLLLDQTPAPAAERTLAVRLCRGILVERSEYFHANMSFSLGRGDGGGVAGLRTSEEEEQPPPPQQQQQVVEVFDTLAHRDVFLMLLELLHERLRKAAILRLLSALKARPWLVGATLDLADYYGLDDRVQQDLAHVVEWVSKDAPLAGAVVMLAALKPTSQMHRMARRQVVLSVVADHLVEQVMEASPTLLPSLSVDEAELVVGGIRFCKVGSLVMAAHVWVEHNHPRHPDMMRIMAPALDVLWTGPEAAPGPCCRHVPFHYRVWTLSPLVGVETRICIGGVLFDMSRGPSLLEVMLTCAGPSCLPSAWGVGRSVRGKFAMCDPGSEDNYVTDELMIEAVLGTTCTIINVPAPHHAGAGEHVSVCFYSTAEVA